MAYMSQDRKKEIAALLKKVMPRTWKYSLAVRHHSTLVLTISAAPVDLLGEMEAMALARWNPAYDGQTRYPIVNHTEVNLHWLDRQFEGARLRQFERIGDALHHGNHDRSDIQTDHFDVGWYVEVRIGRWDKPFVVLQP